MDTWVATAARAAGIIDPQPQVHVTKVLTTDDEHSEVIFE